jgi:hypothetical protein
VLAFAQDCVGVGCALVGIHLSDTIKQEAGAAVS